ncbi:hypothetical protein [Rhizobium leguminosarum]|uniref:hypothetical protein n=1 Tax=Rhizobium leguminosarum TaxID=384 RepID=UPI002F95B2AD
MAQVDQATVLDANGDPIDVATLTAIAKLLGEVTANPTANSLLERTKALKTSVDAVKASVDAVTASLGTGLVAQLGVRTVAQSPAVNIATDQPAIPVDQKSTAHDVAVTLTRPANVTAYSAGDVVGQTAGGVLTFAAIGKSGGTILITRAELELDISAIPSGMTSFRLYLYSSAPPSNIGDNAAFTWTGTDRGPFLAFIDLGAPVLIGGGTLYCDVTGITKQMKLATADISAYLVTAGGYIPAANSEVYKLTLHSVDV